jgi:LacI family transcriptional regulator
VVIDNFKGTYDAIKHFYEQGFKNIAFVTLDSEQTQMVDRLKGYNFATEEFKLSKYTLEIPFKADAKAVIEQFSTFFLNNKKIDAVLFATNYLAVKGFEYGCDRF